MRLSKKHPSTASLHTTRRNGSHLRKFFSLIFDVLIIALCIYFLGTALNIIWDYQPLHMIFGTPSATRKFNTSNYYKSNEDQFYASVQFYFETSEAFCAYNPIKVRAVVFGNRLNSSAVAVIILQSSRFVPDKMDVYGLIPQTGGIVLHEPTDPTLVNLSRENPTALTLEGESTVQWNLEGDYYWGIANGTENVMIKEEFFQGSPIIHISSVDVMTQIKGNQRIEALTYALFGLSILTAQPIIKSIAREVFSKFRPA
jgi:hypothetical protein